MYEPLAIVGTACRFPGAARSPSKLWELLKAPKNIVKQFPPERLHAENFYHENGEMHGRTNVRQKSYLLEEDIRHFDAAFFHINPKEAADMDPQQRILLETVYEAFEAAGWPLSDVDGSQTSVHVGQMTDDYTTIQSRDPDTLGSHTATGTSRAILSNRVSYAYNLRGASLTLDTACSSSLVALHLAAQGLQRGEATQAIVAGSNLLMDTFWYIMESSMHMLSPESLCRMWDKDADGYARGEGCAVLILKTLDRAIRDGDHIECVIRATGVNSDGHTNGITLPSPQAQTALIQQTYQAAGLDPLTDRCQYFECHGTGTQAGDTVECQAIRDAFFPEDKQADADDILYCGSIKTVLGHLEGCAGLAGVIKASLAIQNRKIPPNMHFKQLNPKLERFYRNLEVPTALLPWPETNGGPCRASVNSFGFGGTNAHAILESFDSSSGTTSPTSSYVDAGENSLCPSPAEGRHCGPFVFSARSQSSLVTWLKQFLTYLRENPTVDLDSLSYSLHAKRSVFSHRVAIPMALDRDDLAQKLEDQINALGTSKDGPGVQPAPAADNQPRLLGIFTGQGAQSSRMGYALLQHCGLFRESIGECEKLLKSIPDAPTWSLSKELSADSTTSRVSEAEFSQPLCTAIQIGLVDLLRASGVRFSTVVGHSSGEIGAAYAAGLLTKKDAMGIAYYRGRVAHMSRGSAGEKGRMMAAVMSFDAAAALCAEERFKGRINVAASNSPSSVTLSGSKDAIDEMKAHLDSIDVQARMLQVDVAYHSHHMLACAEKYSGHLKKLDIRVQTPADTQACRWYSSVRTGTNILDNVLGSGLDGQYWLDNLVQPVLFSQAVTLAVQAETSKFTAVLEVGPHPALKGPVNQTLKQAVDYSPQYAGCLSRDKNAVEVFSEMLTTVWYLAPRSFDLAGWRKALGNVAVDPQALKNLPSYAWDHTQIHWRESRVGRNYRLGEQLPHDILGRLWNDSQYEQTWRNTFRLNEMNWVTGHVFQNQVLFPATGYLSLAVDAAKAFVKGRPIKLVEVHDMAIPTALVIGEGDELEVLFTIRSSAAPEKVQSGSVLEAEFVCYSYPDQKNADKTCHGKLLIHLGDSDPADLAPTFISDVELTPLNVDRFYHAVSDIGFGYQGPFRALRSINRCWGQAKAIASWAKKDLDVNCSLQPAVLDIALQTGLSTFISTAEGSMPSAFLPVGIRRALINPNEACSAANASLETEIEAYMTSPGMGKMMETDINVSFKAGTRDHSCAVQMEGVRFQAISEPQPSEDRNIIAKIVWNFDAAYGLVHPATSQDSQTQLSTTYTADEYERAALFRLQSLSEQLKRESKGDPKPHQQALIRYVDATVALIRDDKYPISLKEWLGDDAKAIQDLVRRYPKDTEMTALISGGGSAGTITCDGHIAQLVLQISHKFPRTRILEVGSGSNGNTTAAVLGAIGDAYEQYTCTGASEAIVNALKDRKDLAEASSIGFKMMDVESDLASQGFEAAAYDIVIAANVSGTSPDVSKTVQKLRQLLRPGGFLIATELTGDSLRPTAAIGGSDTWWAGVGATGRARPGLRLGEWDKLLVRSGFSGIDCTLYDQSDAKKHGFSVFATQAMDDRLEVLRDPLTSLDMITPAPVVLIGGETSQVSKLVRKSASILRGWAPEIQQYTCFDLVDCSQLPPDACVISFQDLDKPIFSSPPAANELENFKEVIETSRNILWVTSRRLADDPYANIMIGIGRALRSELPHINLHFLDFDKDEPWDIQAVMAKFLRLVFSSAHSVTDGMLWVEDPEVVIRDSQAMVARVVPDHVANEVYNAKRRRVTKLVDPAEPIDIAKDAASSESVLVCSRPAVLPQDQLPVQVELSVPLQTGEGPACYLCYGTLKDQNGTAVLTLSKTDSSVVTVSKDTDLATVSIQGCDAESLVNLASLLIAADVVSKMPSSGTTLVCGASEELADRISSLASDAGRKVTFISVTTMAHKEQDGWFYIHPKSTAHSVNQMFPLDSIANVLSLSQEDASIISPWLPADCSFQTLDVNALSQHSVQEALKADRKSRGDRNWAKFEPSVLSIGGISLSRTRGSNLGHLSTVTNWKRDSPVAAIVPGHEPTALLSPNKTYFLVGMAGELGQSLTSFMVRSGARHIVLSSRNPKGDQQWIRVLQQAGINIRLVKMDVTIRSQVRDTVAELRRTMPEIGGVTNAALVLDPGVFVNLSAESIARQMKPKITGTANLDDEFKTDKLDFFLTFGSLLTVVGNAGQPIYHAGNAYMASLVQNRRQRGLAAAVLNFGLLVDVGYVARSDRAADSHVEEWLRNDIRIPLSEADFHHVIMQGIVEGKPGSGSGEVIMGLETYVDQGQDNRPPWADGAFCSHMVRVSKGTNEGQSDNAPSSAQQWQQKLEEATTVEEATQPIAELLSKKVEAMIHVSLHSIHLDEPLSHLGIDSINAIAIRKWFREKLGVDISMLKILGRDSVASILKLVAEQYLAKKPAQSSVPKPKAANMEAPKPAKPTKAPTPAVSKATAKIPSRPANPVPPKGHSETADTGSLQSLRSEHLSYAQAGFYYLSTISESPTSFNITVKFNISGPLNAERFRRAFQKVMLHHDALQSAFLVNSESAEVMQHVVKGKASQLTQVQSSKETAVNDWQKAFREIQHHEYVLAKGDTLQAALVCHDAQWHTLIVGFHNIAIDALSIGYFIADIDRAYQFRPLPQNHTSYLEFTRQQTDDVRAGRMDQNIAYWKELLNPLPESLPLLPMAKVKTRDIPRSYGHYRVEKELSSEVVQQVKQLCQANGATIMHFYLAVMQVALCRLLRIDDICIGIMYTGRDPASDFAETVGHLASILPVRFRGLLEKSLPDVLANTSKTVLACLDNANVPFAVIADSVRGGASDTDGQPLIQVAYNYRVGETDSSPMGNCTITRQELEFTSLYDLTIDVLQSESHGNVLSVRCTDDFYSQATTEFLTETFVNVLESMVRSPSALVKDLALFSTAQLDKATTVAQGPDVQHSWPQDLSTRFEQVAAKFPNSVAVKDSHEKVTYSQLKQRVGTYASILLETKVTAGSRVAVLCEPSVDLYAAMLAVFHIGAVFVPLDVSVPAARRNAMMDACKPDILVFHAATAASATKEHAAVRSLNLTSWTQDKSSGTASFPKRTVSDPRAESYILFTSGSTGVPKGIKLHQQGMMNYAAYTSKIYGFGQVIVLQQTSIGFDLAFGQIYNAFTNGGTLIAASVEARGDPDTISRLIHDEKVEYTICTPSEYSLLLNYASDVLKRCNSWRCAHTAGEALPERLIEGLKDLKLPNLMLTDAYGPAEAFIVTNRDIPVHAGAAPSAEDADKVGSIGHVLPNTAVYVVHEDDGSLLPLGLPGEICIAGGGVANGYLDATLSSAKFVPNTHATTHYRKRGWTTMYKSGDRGVLHADGSVIFMGRAQGGRSVVKLRGLRIDLDEVVGAVLAAAPRDIADAAVTVRGEPQFLVCHIVFKPGRRLDAAQLNALLGKLVSLPRYMVPSVIVPLDRLPVTPNGKLDSTALEAFPLPDVSAPTAGGDGELTEMETKLRAIWIDLVGAAARAVTIGPHSSFFAVGGSSLLLVHLLHIVHRQLGVKVHLRLLREAEDLRSMAAVIGSAA